MPGQWASSDRASRLPSDWPRIRRRILKRDEGQCTWFENGHRCATAAVEVDHIVPNDDHSDANLRSLCTPHHGAKSAREGVDARAAIAAKRFRPVEPHPGLRRRT
jgi:5-methylcytosine-specific restriction endonuclease McrA